MAKKYCFSCAHWNPEGANFCENCGARLPEKESATPLQQQAGVNKWKVISAVSIAIIVILASGLFYYYSNYSVLEERYETRYAGIEANYSQLNTTYNKLKKQDARLNESYNLLLDANRTLKKRLDEIANRYVLLPNSTVARYLLGYTPSMEMFVDNITHGYNGSEDDLEGDIYQIHREWVHIFQYDTNVGYSGEPIPMLYWGISTRTLPTGETYMSDVEFMPGTDISAWTASQIFQHKRGVCYHFAYALTSLYNYYFDSAHIPYRVYCLEINDSGGLSHECVLIINDKRQVAIVDWIIVTLGHNDTTGALKVFMPVREATKLHEAYWHATLNYVSVFSRDSPIFSNTVFKNNDEFYAWVEGSG